MSTQRAEKIFARMTASKQVHEAVLLVENAAGEVICNLGYGGKDHDFPFLLASVTKLFTTACILKLKDEGRLLLEDPLERYFDDRVLNGLHIYRGVDYSRQLTLYDLLFQTSGLPDVYEETSHSLKKQLIAGDQFACFEDMLSLVKRRKPHFPPRAGQRAYYADINFDLLGKIIEQLTGWPLEKAFAQMIFKPLSLKNTYLPCKESDYIPWVYYKDQLLHRPQFVRCSRASGGCVGTARELMVFLKGFFGGMLFDPAVFAELAHYRKLQLTMGPICYGGGFMQIPLGGAVTLFQGEGELLGHSGSTGSFAFYLPTKDLFLVGDLNQMANPALPIRLAMQIAMG